MTIKMSPVSVDRIFFDIRTPAITGDYEFTVDCGAVYFGAVYNDDGTLRAIDQYFYTEAFSRDDMEEALEMDELLSVDSRDFPVKTYLLSREEAGNEWLRFHAVVPEVIDPDYFHQKYIGE
ncbi:MAG TPA: hypothetical protein PKA10_13505 [Selenomonadales bacterium]|nr:hypothetical protein [Selenomonadales bacterium]